MKVKANVKAGGINLSNHTQTVKGLRTKSGVKAGRIAFNHSQTVSR